MTSVRDLLLSPRDLPHTAHPGDRRRPQPARRPTQRPRHPARPLEYSGPSSRAKPCRPSSPPHHLTPTLPSTSPSMATAPPPNHDPALPHVAPSQQPPAAGAQSATGVPGEVPSSVPMNGLGSEQVMALLKQLPGINFPRVSVRLCLRSLRMSPRVIGGAHMRPMRAVSATRDRCRRSRSRWARRAAPITPGWALGDVVEVVKRGGGRRTAYGGVYAGC